MTSPSLHYESENTSKDFCETLHVSPHKLNLSVLFVHLAIQKSSKKTSTPKKYLQTHLRW